MTLRQACGRALVCCFTLTLLPLGAVAQSDRGTPKATMMASELDLAAMTLTPFDLYSADLPGFGFDASSVRDLETEIAATRSDLSEAERDEFRTKYEATGFQRRAVSDMFRPAFPLEEDETGSVITDFRISTAVTEYATTKGATEGFDFVEDESDDPTSTDLTDVRTFGDQSEITKIEYEASPPTNPTIHVLNLTFRLGRLTADVVVYSFTGTEVDLQMIERLGDLLQRRIEQVRADGAPGLSNQVLRLTPTSSQIANSLMHDRYLNIGSNTPPTYFDIIDALEGGKTWEEAIEDWLLEPEIVDERVIEQPASYQYFAYFRDNDVTDLPTEQEFAVLGYLYVILYEEVSIATATQTFTDFFDSFEGGGMGEYEIDDEFPPFGTDSFAAVVTQDGRTRYATVARVRSRMAYVYFNVPEEQEVAPVAVELMGAQVACLETPGERCAPAEMPQELLPEERPTLKPPGGR